MRSSARKAGLMKRKSEMITKQTYKNPDIQDNRDEFLALTEMMVGLKYALEEINKSAKNVKDMGENIPDGVVGLRKGIKSEIKKIEKRLLKLHREYMKMTEKCDHDFVDEGETKRCRKCGIIETKK